MSVRPIDARRRHTLHFLEEIRPFAPVFLDTEVDMSAVSAHRAAAKATGRRYSFVSYLLLVAAGVLARHPEANAAIRGRVRPRVSRYDTVSGKLTLDKTLGGRRVVLSAVLPDLHRSDLDEVQRQVDHYRDGDPATMPEFAGVRALHRLPWPLRPFAFRRRVRPLSRRPVTFGTFALTSLGHAAVDGFHSVGGTTVTLGAGRIVDRPVVRDSGLAIAPVMRLSLTFDHRVIDGAEAADVLTEIRDGLEAYVPGRVAAAASR